MTGGPRSGCVEEIFASNKEPFVCSRGCPQQPRIILRLEPSCGLSIVHLVCKTSRIHTSCPWCFISGALRPDRRDGCCGCAILADMANCVAKPLSILLHKTKFCREGTHRLEVYCSPRPDRSRSWPRVLPMSLVGMISISALDNGIPHHASHISRKLAAVHHLQDVLASKYQHQRTVSG